MSVLSGNPDIFLALALFFIAGMAGFFRMMTIAMMFLIVIFLLLFSTYISQWLLVLAMILGGLGLGFIISNIFDR